MVQAGHNALFLSLLQVLAGTLILQSRIVFVEHCSSRLHACQAGTLVASSYPHSVTLDTHTWRASLGSQTNHERLG